MLSVMTKCMLRHNAVTGGWVHQAGNEVTDVLLVDTTERKIGLGLRETMVGTKRDARAYKNALISERKSTAKY